MISNSYKNLSKIYNSHISFFWETNWKRIESHLINGKKYQVLDLGCGTGNSIPYLKPYIGSYLGIDLSTHMLEIANREYPDFEFDCYSVGNFPTLRKYDLIVCAFDTMNHLKNKDEWEKTFSCVSNCLADDGLFIFDAVTPFDHKYNWPNYFNVKESNEVFLFQRGEYSSEFKKAKIHSSIFIKSDNGWTKDEDVVEQISFKSKSIIKMLNKFNIDLIAEIDLKTGVKPVKKTEVIIYICSK